MSVLRFWHYIVIALWHMSIRQNHSQQLANG